MASQVMRITLKAYDHQLVDQSAAKIIETVKKTGSQVSGPVPLPTKKEVVTILRAVHKYKDSREQFEQRTHKRLIDITTPNNKTVDALSRLGREGELIFRYLYHYTGCTTPFVRLWISSLTEIGRASCRERVCKQV